MATTIDHEKGGRMRKRYSLLIAACTASFAVPLAASPAAAYEAGSSCDVKYAGASGISPVQGHLVGSWNWSGGNALTSVHLEAKDTYADGLNPAVRLVTKQRDGDTHYWSWHHNTKGSGTTDSWNTSATDTQGITSAWVEGGLFDGDKLVGVC
jgi:hypothetical protein